MGRRSAPDRALVALLALLLIGAAAAPTAEDARRAARTALDRGELTRAEAILEEALARFGRQSGEAAYALRVLRAEANIGRGHYDAAAADLAFELPSALRKSETAVRQRLMLAYSGKSEAIEEARTLAAAHQPAMLAEVYLFLARRGESEAREAIRLARRYKRRATEAKAMAALAYVLAQQQRFAESVQWGETALALAASLGITKTVQQIQGNLGWAYFELGDYETASALFTSAEKTAGRIGAERDRVAWLIQLGNIRHQQRDWAAADRYNRAAVAIGEPLRHAQTGYALANLARIALELGRFDDARAFNARALQWKKGDADAELESRIVDARIATVTNDTDRAERLLTAVLRDAKRLTTRMEAESRLAQLHARSRRDAQATQHFERAVAAAREARREVQDRDLRFSFFNSVRSMFGAYVDFLASRNRVEEALAVTETSRAQLLEEELKITPAKGTLDARAIARQNGVTVLCYWLGRDRSWLWVITPANVTLRQLPPDTVIEKSVEAYRRDLLGPRGSLQLSGARGRELFRILVQPAGIASDAHVVVVADGLLHTLNFETLVSGPERYWIEDVVVQNAGSLQLLERRPRQRVETQSPSILLVGNAPATDRAYPPLPHAGVEMRRIAALFQRKTILEGSAATPAAYRNAAPGTFAFVHFVAHGVATRKRPLDSAVILAGDRLLAREIVQSSLQARLVTISSCHGAGSRTYAGEGVVGLAWAFLSAGADQVIAALWEVDDQSTPALMEQMYAGIRAGRSPAVALRDAKLRLVRAKNVNRRPRYWAPFVLYAGT